MRIVLPFLVPLACLLGILVVPDKAVAFSAALLSSIITLGLAAPTLFSLSDTSGDEPEAANASKDTTPQLSTSLSPRAASSSRSPRTSWGRHFWRAGIALEVAAIAWTFVSLGGLVIAPENAHSWSLHLGGSMLLMMFWTPLVVFIRPSDANTSVDDHRFEEDTAPDFVSEEEQTLHSSVSGQKQTEGNDQSFWSYGETQGDSLSGEDASVDVAPRKRTDAKTQPTEDVKTRRPPSPDSGDAWAAWPDEDPSFRDPSESAKESAGSAAAHERSRPDEDADDAESRRALWSFPEDDDHTADRAPEPSSNASPPREIQAAQKAAAAEWEDSDHNDEMAWDILDSILEEDESKSRSSDDGGSWEPDEWPDFNYDV